MAWASELRGVAVAFLVLFAGSVSVLALTPANWAATFLVAASCAATLVLVDILVFAHLLKRDSRARLPAIVTLSAVTGISLVILAVAQVATDDSPQGGFPYLIVSEFGDAAEAKAVPSIDAGTLAVYFPGDDVRVSCYVEDVDRRWYKLHDGEEWLAGNDLLASPHTGLGTPPRCPD